MSLAVCTPAAPSVITPGMLSIDIDPDAPYIAGYLNPADASKAANILAHLRARGVLVTARDSGEAIMLTIARPITSTLLDRIAAHAALLRAALACPHCGRRHSLSPPYGWCWPCAQGATR